MVGEVLKDVPILDEAFLEPGTVLRAQASQCLLALDGARVAHRTTVEGATGVPSALRRWAEGPAAESFTSNTSNILS
jgi:hypothetical protein